MRRGAKMFTVIALMAVAQPPMLMSQWVYDKQPEFVMLDLMNAEREKPLVLNNDLSKIAKDHAENMIRTGQFKHIIEGRSPQDRVRNAGLCKKDTVVGENIGLVSGSIIVKDHTEKMFDAFKNSSGHFKNIKEKRWLNTGIAYAIDQENTKILWVIMFSTELAEPFRTMPYYLQP